MQISLDGKWKLACFPEKGGKNPPFGALPADAPSMELDAEVPGEVQLELWRAGAEPDPFVGANYYSYVKYESCGWVYSRGFMAPELPPDERLTLRFDGIDTVADVFVNGALVGHSKNMLVEQEFDVTEAVRAGENEIAVHIFSAMNFARGKYYPVGMLGSGGRNQISRIRKAPHCFGWDIAPRIVTAGLWRSVSLRSVKPTRITETYFAVSKLGRNSADLRWAVRFDSDADDLEDFLIKVSGICGESSFSFEVKPNFVSMNGTYSVQSPLLWWPKGYGEQKLYEVATELYRGGELCDSKRERIGLRLLALERDFTPGKQKFLFRVNGEPIFCKGTNWVPLDAFHSRAKSRIERAVALVSDCGCNIIRSWGGGIYEDDLLYDLCDREGIMVWQDFALGNTIYPQDGSLDEALTDEIGKLVRRIRNHACVCVYAADNEIDQKNESFDYPEYRSRYKPIAEELFPRLLQMHDPYRFYLRSSPEIPEGLDSRTIPEQHTWGARAWYKDPFYKDSSASFIGEAGYHGCPAPESLRKFIPERDLWPMWNDSWASHSTEDIRYGSGHGRNELMRNQVKLMFGEAPDELERFSLLSQVSQAEAVKFFIERARAKKWSRSGIIWWNMIDCWPQISDAVVDYYFTKKLAYGWIKRAQQPVLVFLGEAEGWNQPVWISNDSRERVSVTYEASDADTGEVLASGTEELAGNENLIAATPRVVSSEKRLVLLRWSAGGTRGFNHYLTGMPPYSETDVRRWVDIIESEAEKCSVR